MEDKNFTLVIHNVKGDLVYLIVALSDVGHHVVAEAYNLQDAKVIVDALDKASKIPPPF